MDEIKIVNFREAVRTDKAMVFACADIPGVNDQVTEMEAKILAFIKSRGKGVSMVELERGVEGFLDQGSGRCLMLDQQNLTLWVDISENGAAALTNLIKAGKIDPIPCGTFIYAIDGKVLNIPIAKRAKYYKKTRWLPLVFNHVRD